MAEAPGEGWLALDVALRQGRRGLPRGDSLARLLDRHRGPRPGSWRPWTPREDELVGRLRLAEAARRTGRTLGAVSQHPWELGLTRRQKG